MKNQDTLQLYFWPTPNTYKVTMLLEELNLPYDVNYIDIGKGEQFQEHFLEIAPNNRIPALVDPAPLSADKPISVFESGAILVYLAEKHQQFLPQDIAERADVMQWLFWQMGGLGPMSGQANHFIKYAPEQVPYGIKRYSDEVNRLFGVMERRLKDREYLAGEYSIADMACWPWVRIYENYNIDLTTFVHLNDWYQRIAKRPATIRAIAVGASHVMKPEDMSDEAKKVLFGQQAQSTEKAIA